MLNKKNKYELLQFARHVAAALLLAALSACGGGDEGGDSAERPITPVGQVTAVDGFSVLRPGVSTRIDLSAFVRGPEAMLSAMSSEQPGCTVSNLSGLTAEVINESGLCEYAYTISNSQSSASAQLNMLASSKASPILPTLSETMTLASSSTTYDLETLLGADWPTGYSLDPDSLAVQGGGEQGSVTATGNVLTYIPPSSPDWNRIAFILKHPDRPGEDALGMLYITISDASNRPPIIDDPKYDFNAATGSNVITHQTMILDLATLPGLNIHDPEEKAWQLVEVQSYSATVVPVEPDSVMNKRFTFTAGTIGNHIISYVVADHYGGFATGVIRIGVGPQERTKDWVDAIIGKVTYRATPLYSETFAQGVTAVEGVWDSGVNLQSIPPGNTIAGVSAVQARTYCGATSAHLASQTELDLFRSTVAVDAVREHYPHQRNYVVSNDGGVTFLSYDLVSGRISDYDPSKATNHYVICVVDAGDPSMSYTARPDTPIAGHTNTAISDGITWWSLGDVVSEGGISALEVTTTNNAGEGTLSEANFRLSPAGCVSGRCVLQASGDELEFGSASLRLQGGGSNSLGIGPVTFWQNAKMAAAYADIDHSPADGTLYNMVAVILKDRNGQPVAGGTKVKLTYHTTPSEGVSVAPVLQPGGTTFVADANGEVTIGIAYNNPEGGSVAVSIDPVVAGIPGSAQTVNSTFEPTAPDPTLSYVYIAPNSVQVKVGESVALTAMAHYSDGTSKVVTADSSWRSGDTSIATVNSVGTLTGAKAGMIVVTATYQGQVGSVGVTVTNAGGMDRDYDGVLDSNDDRPDIPNSHNAVDIIGGVEQWVIEWQMAHYAPASDNMNSYYMLDAVTGNHVLNPCTGSNHMFDASVGYCTPMTEAEAAARYIEAMPSSMKARIEAGAH